MWELTSDRWAAYTGPWECSLARSPRQGWQPPRNRSLSGYQGHGRVQPVATFKSKLAAENNPMNSEFPSETWPAHVSDYTLENFMFVQIFGEHK